MGSKEKNRKNGYPFFLPKAKPNQKTEDERAFETMENKFSQIYSYVKTWGEKDLEELIMFLIRKIKQETMIKIKSKEKFEKDPYTKKNDIVIFIKGWEVEKLEEFILFLIRIIEKKARDGFRSYSSVLIKKMKEMKERLNELEPPRKFNEVTAPRYGVYYQR